MLVVGARVQSASIIINPGAVAQLGERLICIQEVAGSIPTSSTSFYLAPRSLVLRKNLLNVPVRSDGSRR